MQKTFSKLFIFVLVISFVIPFSPVLTVSTTTEFNPHYIISDDDLQDWKSMDRADIQAFLENYPGILADLKTTDKDGVEKPASEIIYQAAQDYKINPKYILVKLQKEMSLITDTTPTQRQLDYACGYGCPDAGGCSQKNTGFGKQVDSAAGIMRWYYDNVVLSPIVKRPNMDYIIDGTLVHPLTFATAFLYTYTPHLTGNKNFWNLWQRWFQQIYPDGTLMRSNSTSTIYLLADGKKRPISSMTVLNSRFNPKMIVVAPEAEIARYPEGRPISLPNYSILKCDNSFYLLDNETIRPFTSFDVVRKMGYQQEEIIDVSSLDLQGYIVGKNITLDTNAPLGRIIKLKENNGLYYLNDNYYYPIVNEQIAKINYPNLQIEKGGVADLSNLQRGFLILFKDGTLVGIRGTSKVYVVEKGFKRHIPSEDIFNGLGYDWNNVVWVDELTVSTLPDGQSLYLRLNTDGEATNTESDASVNASNDIMQATTDGQSIYLGDKFTTNVSTYLVADYKTGKILSGKNIDEVRPLASFTKVMTAYELMKQNLSLNSAVAYNDKRDRSTYHTFRILNGEKIKNQDLLKSMLLSSVNTAAKMLANQLGGEAKFVKKMNTDAKTWKLVDTQFTDSYGYDLENKSTARQFLKIFTSATANQTLLKIMGLPNYEYLEIVDKDKNPRHFDQNSNLLVNKENLGFNILASKTAYLNEAGAGLAMLVERPKDQKKFVIITMGNPDYTHRFDEPQRLTEWAISSF